MSKRASKKKTEPKAVEKVEEVPEPAERVCVICGGPTDDKATAYICTDRRIPGTPLHTTYEPLTRYVCASCAQRHHDHDVKRIIFYLALQIAWVMPLTRGFSLISIVCALLAIYGLVMIVRVIADNLWRRLKADQPEPAWLSDGESIEDLASTCLADHVRKQYKKQGKRMETTREYQRSHSKNNEGTA